MATIQKTVEIDAPLDAVWPKIADAQNIASLIGFLESSEVDGDQRVCTLADGGRLLEKIVSVDEGLKRVAYSITESPLGMEYHAASMQLFGDGGKTRFVWTVDLAPAAAAEHLEPLLQSACEDMRSTLAA